MKVLTRFAIVASFVFAVSCSNGSDDPEPALTPDPPASAPTCTRIGANCKDGTTSTATGSGACSHHGGVASWICK